MPIKHAALKQIRKDRKRQQRNQAAGSKLKTLTKHLLALLTDQKWDEAKGLMPAIAKAYDRAASTHIIHANTAARAKSKLMRRLNRRPSSASSAAV